MSPIHRVYDPEKTFLEQLEVEKEETGKIFSRIQHKPLLIAKTPFIATKLSGPSPKGTLVFWTLLSLSDRLLYERIREEQLDDAVRQIAQEAQ